MGIFTISILVFKNSANIQIKQYQNILQNVKAYICQKKLCTNLN